MIKNVYKDYVNPNSVHYDERAISSSIINILSTRKGSMPGKPEFGSDLYSIIFDPLDHITIDTIQHTVIRALIEWEPRINIQDVEIFEQPEYNRVVITVVYSFILFDQIINSKTDVVFNK